MPQRLLLRILLVFIFFPPGISHGQEGVLWTVDSAMENLEKRSLLAKALNAEVEHAEGQQSEANAVWLPRGELEGNFTTSPGFKGASAAGYQDEDDWGPVVRGTIDGGIPLFAFGQLLVVQELGRLGVQVAEARKALKLAQLKLALKNALLEVQRSKGRMKQIEKRSERAAMLEQVVLEAKRDNDPTISDQLELMGSDGERDLAAERLQYDKATRQVLFLLNDPSGSLDVPAIEAPTIPSDVSAQLCIERALEHRPDFLLGRTLLELGEVNALLQRLRFLPGIALVASYSRRYAPMDTNQIGAFRSDPRNGGGFGTLLAAEWDLDFPTRWRELEKAKGLVSSGNHQLAFALAEGLYKVTLQMRRVLSAEELSRSSVASAEAARKWYLAAQEAYRKGMGTFQDVIESYRALSQAELAAIDSSVAYSLRLEALHTHVGAACWGIAP